MLASPPRYAVVVATYNRGAKIAPLLESILQSEATDFEMVIVDQSKNESTRLAVEPFLRDPRIRYIHSNVIGTSHARNQGLALTTAPIIAITDDDCTVPSDWLPQIAEPFERHAEVGVVYCNVDPVPSKEPGHTPHIRFSSDRLLSRISDIHPRQRLWMGAGMAIRRLMLVDVQGFDESLGPGCKFAACEDNDIAFRGLLKGWWVYETTAVAVLHDGFRTLEQLREHATRDFYGIGATIAKYMKKGHFRIAAMVVPLLYRFGLVEPAADVFGRRLPRGFRRPYMLIRGLVDGLRTPLDPVTLCYRRDSP